MATVPERFQAVVVGGGPAGLAASLWLGRYRRRTLLIDAGEQRNARVERLHGYLGSDPTRPGELVEQARRQVASYDDVECRRGRALDAGGTAGAFTVATDAGEVRADRLVLTTGLVDELPDVDGFNEHYGASAFHCPACDGYEARERRVVVLGWNEALVGFARTLQNWARSVVVVTNGAPLEGGSDERRRFAHSGIDVVDERATRLLGTRGDLRGVELAGGGTLDCDLLFFSIAHRPTTVLAERLGCELDAEGYVVIDPEGRTSVDGVFAAGDVAPGLQLVQMAAAQGAAAGVACALSLS